MRGGRCNKLGKIMRFSTDSRCKDYEEHEGCCLIPENAHDVCGTCGYFIPTDGRCSGAGVCLPCEYMGDRGPAEEDPIVTPIFQARSEMYAKIAQIVEESRKYHRGKKETAHE